MTGEESINRTEFVSGYAAMLCLDCYNITLLYMMELQEYVKLSRVLFTQEYYDEFVSDIARGDIKEVLEAFPLDDLLALEDKRRTLYLEVFKKVRDFVQRGE